MARISVMFFRRRRFWRTPATGMTATRMTAARMRMTTAAWMATSRTTAVWLTTVAVGLTAVAVWMTAVMTPSVPAFATAKAAAA